MDGSGGRQGENINEEGEKAERTTMAWRIVLSPSCKTEPVLDKPIVFISLIILLLGHVPTHYTASHRA